MGKLNLFLENNSQVARIDGSVKDINSFIEFRKILFDKTELWGYGRKITSWYIIYDESFEEELKIWEDVFNT